MRNILVLILLMRLVAWATDMFFTWLVLYFYHFVNIIFQRAIGTV